VPARLLVTFDLGFGDVRRYPPGGHDGIILLRLEDQHPELVLDVLRRLLAQQDLDSVEGALVVVTDTTVRIRR
jgi:hypothetical protein